MVRFIVEVKNDLDNDCNRKIDDGLEDTTSDPTDGPDALELPLPGFTFNGVLAVFGLMLITNRVYLRKRK